MVYGLNFNGKQIPEKVRKIFAKRVDSNELPGITKYKLPLQGVCNDSGEVDQMKMQADNGHRTLRVIGPRKRFGNTWFGIYCN